MPHLVAGALTGVALALLPAVPAAPAHATTLPVPGAATRLRLSLTFPEATTSGARTVTLFCRPNGGSHPDADRACQELSARGGKIERDPGDAVCVLIYAPVVAVAEGHWHGRPTRFKRTYANECVMHAHTGKIFSF
ncbi:SSI family serine proteinase inhibitor [Spirillospora sp. NPDC048911]|uniref:SSI family serine proteinase inhibitor n=1 Tax=Spirillospora sp. NPDC048911 TaxID=3364527 RepID=UPI003716A593